MRYIIVYKWTNKPPGPPLSTRSKDIRASSDERARIRGKALVDRLNKKGSEKYALLRIAKVIQEEIHKEISLQ